jgi:organic anion transporter 5A
MEVGKTWIEVKRIAVDRIRWKLFTDALRFGESHKNEMDGWTVGWLDGWMVGWMVGWMDGWMDVWLVGWMDG